MIENRCDFQKMKGVISKCIQEKLLVVENKKEYEINEVINKLTFSGEDHLPIVQQQKMAVMVNLTEKDEIDVMKYKWNRRPKYWEKYNGNMEWNESIIKDCNKTKGCLHNCGKNNSRDMLQCDGCGKWSHFVCEGIKEIVKLDEDFICLSCQTNLINRNDEIYKSEIVNENIIDEKMVNEINDHYKEKKKNNNMLVKYTQKVVKVLPSNEYLNMQRNSNDEVKYLYNIIFKMKNKMLEMSEKEVVTAK